MGSTMSSTVGFNQGAVMQDRLEPFLEACAAHGVVEVELRAPKVLEALHHLRPADLRELLAESGITVTAINSMDDFALVPDENTAMLCREAETIADLCDATGCDLVVAPVGRWFTAERPSREWVRETSAKRLHIIEEILVPRGIRVGVEPIAFPEFTVWSLEESVEIIEAAGSETAVLVADVYNLMQGESTAGSMRTHADRLGMIHVNDAPHRRYPDLDVMYARRFPGEGVLDPARWVREARDGGYTGPVSMEIFMKQVWEMETSAAVRLCAEKAAAFLESSAPGA